jgi:MFS transporter, FSR family, fosmidomycin resistance protein
MANIISQESTKTQGDGSTIKVISVALAHMFHDVFSTMIATLLPVFIERFQISTFMAGVMPVLVRAPSIFQPFFGRIADRKDVRWALIALPTFTAFFMTMTGVVNNYFGVLVLLVLTGFSAALFHTVGAPAAGKFAGKEIGKALGMWMIGARIGAAISPMLVVFIIGLTTLRGLPILIILGLISSIILFTQFKKESIYLSNTTQSAPIKNSWKIVRPIMLPLLAISLMQSFLGILYATYLPTFLTQSGNPLWVAGVSLTLFSAAGIPASYLGGTLSDKIGRKKIFLMSAAATVILNFCFLALQGWVSVIFVILIGFSSFLATPLPMSFVQTSFPEMRSYANGMYVGTTFFLRSFALLLVGLLSDYFGMRILYVVFAFVFLISIPIIIFKLPENA